MRFPQITKKFVQKELYKLCDGYDTRQIINEYSSKSTWQPQDIIKRMIHACLERTSLEDICSSTEGPSADTVHKRCSELQFEHAEKLVNGWLLEVVSRFKFHPNTKITLAFDLYDQPFYGETSHAWVTGTKRKKGTNYAVSYLVVTVATQNIRCPVAVRLMTKKRQKEKAAMVSQILDDLFVWLPVKRVLFDRGFCQEDIIHLAEDRGLEYVIAAIRHSSIKQAAQIIQKTVQEHASLAGINVNDTLALGQWARQRGLDTFRVEHVATGKNRKLVPLVAAFVRKRTHNRDPLKRRIYCLYLYITNTKVSARRVVKLYSKRWIVETDIRCTNDFRAVTNSTSPQLRLLLYGLAMVFNALWVVFSTFINRLTDSSIHSNDLDCIFFIKQADELVCIARWFVRFMLREIFPLLSFQGVDA
ncbi:MAG: transposase [Candidatus Heimdallarchaeota archaeon]|nr:transposase [Candidatus Heimdallarchaeota archaeon]